LSGLEGAQLLQSLLLLLPLFDVFDVLFVVLSCLGLEVAVVFLRLFQFVLNLAVRLLSFLHSLHRDLFSGRCSFLVLFALFFHKTLPQIFVALQLFKSSLPIDELSVHSGTLVGSVVGAWPARGQPGRALLAWLVAAETLDLAQQRGVPEDFANRLQKLDARLFVVLVSYLGLHWVQARVRKVIQSPAQIEDSAAKWSQRAIHV